MDTELAMRAFLVDPDLRQSNWQLSRCGSMKERNHFPMIDSNSLAMVGRSDIGLRSLQMDVGQKTLLELRSNNTVVTRSSAFVIL